MLVYFCRSLSLSFFHYFPFPSPFQFQLLSSIACIRNAILLLLSLCVSASLSVCVSCLLLDIVVICAVFIFVAGQVEPILFRVWCTITTTKTATIKRANIFFDEIKWKLKHTPEFELKRLSSLNICKYQKH